MLREAEAALGVERSRSTLALAEVKKRKRPGVGGGAAVSGPPRKRSAPEILEDRAKARSAWRAFAFSIAYDALLPKKKARREIGDNEKEAVSVMREQRGKIAAAVRARWMTLGPPGHEFARAFVQRYERSVIAVIRDPRVAEESSSAEMHCAISKNAIAASSARRVTIRYRGPGGAARESVPAIVTRDWADRIEAWFDLLSVDDRIAERAGELRAAEAKGDFVVPHDLLERWKGKKAPAIAQIAAQDEDIFERWSGAVRAWLTYPPPARVWPGWFG